MQIQLLIINNEKSKHHHFRTSHFITTKKQLSDERGSVTSESERKSTQGIPHLGTKGAASSPTKRKPDRGIRVHFPELNHSTDSTEPRNKNGRAASPEARLRAPRARAPWQWA
jgi:hypothetical protein